MVGKNLKTITPNSQISELPPPLLELNEELTRYTLFNKSRPCILLYKSGFKIFCGSNNFKITFCTVGDHRSNGLLERLAHTVKTKLLAMPQEQQKYTLQNAVSKIIWNLRLSCQSKIKCSPFEIHFNRKPNTIWIQLASRKSSII